MAKGVASWAAITRQVSNSSDPTKVLQQLASACGLGHVFGKAKGKGRGSPPPKGKGKTKGGPAPPAPITENGKPAFMETHKGDVVPITFVCHNTDCRYPHYSWRSTCSNCKLERRPEQEPRTFDRSKVKPRLQLDPLAQAGKKHWVPPKPGAPPTAKADGSGAAGAPSVEDVSMDEEKPEAAPFIVPAALDHKAVKLLLSQNMEVGIQYKEHFKVTTAANSDLKNELHSKRDKLKGLTDFDATKYAEEIAALQADVERIQAKLAAQEDGAAADVAPGAVNDTAGKLNLLLSRHLDTVAKEEASFVQMQNELDAQIGALQAKHALARRLKAERDRANAELQSALEHKVANLGMASAVEAKLATVTDLKAKQDVQCAIQEAITPQWKEQNGLSAMPMEGIQAIILLSLQMASSMPEALAHAAPNVMPPQPKRAKVAENSGDAIQS